MKPVVARGPLAPSALPLSAVVMTLSAVLFALNGVDVAGAADAPRAPSFVRAAGVLPRLPTGAFELPSAGAPSQLTLDVTLAPRDQSALESFAQEVSTPGTAEFRHFLAPGQFEATFGPAPRTIAAVRTWLAGAGLAVGPTASDGLIVPVRGTGAEVARAFGISFEQVRLPSGRTARMPSSEPLVPAALAPYLGVVGLDDLASPTPQLVSASRPSASRAVPSSAGLQVRDAQSAGPVPTSSCSSAISASGGAYTSDQLAQAYSFPSLYASGDEGQGVTIGLYELEPYQPSDVTAFENCYSPVLDPAISDVTVNGAAANSCNGLPSSECTPAGSGESALDIETAIGLAPKANIEVYVGSDAGGAASNPEALSTYAAMVDQDSASVISTSWGECERDLGSAQIRSEASLFEQAVAQGQTIVAAAGDTGSEDCVGTSQDQGLAVDDPASQPWVTAVGGTSISSLGPPPVERAWNDASGAGGGGISTEWTMPTWQVGPGVDNAFTAASTCPLSSEPGSVSCREVPDVSADADPERSPFAAYWNGAWGGYGGTSMAAPMWAALFALAEQGQTFSLGNADPLLYEAGCLSTRPFNDVTSGDNDWTNTNGGLYQATAGYDLATGLGTPIANELVGDLRNPPAPSPCPVPPPPCNSNDRASASSTSSLPSTGLGFSELSSPVRIADTRTGASDPTTYAGDTLCPGGKLTVDIPSSVGLPSDAGAIVAQLTAVAPSASGYLSAFPAGSAWPGTANVNFAAGQTAGNLVTVGLGTDAGTGSSAVTVFNGATGADTDFTLDLYGYFAPPNTTSTPPTGDAYVPLTPTRIYDTRSGSAEPGAGETLVAGGSAEVQVTGVAGVPQNASAVVVNVAVTDTTASSYVQGYATGSPPSSTSPTVDQNWVAGETLSTKAVIGVGTSGSITLANHAGDADVVVDVDGYFTAPGASGALFNSLSTPVRILDTRPGGTGGGASAQAQVVGQGGVAVSASGGVFNVADVVGGSGDGNFLTVYPAGQDPPLAADVNYTSGDLYTVVDNASYGTAGAGSAVGIYNGPVGTANANIVVDEFGWFSAS